jgi:NADH-quinone oxidoreductase subunit C
MESNHFLYEHLKSQYNQEIKINCREENWVIGSLTVDDILKVVSKIREDQLISMEILISICCVDYPNNEKRFELIYNFLSIKNNSRLLLKTQVNESSIIPSITSIFPNASWYEREIWDLYGVIFSGHDDMRRIITDYGFVGHPMRKDFPLTGYIEMHYTDDRNAVVQNIVNLQQDFRFLEFQSQWNDKKTLVLPGDEKAHSNNE